MTGVAEALLGHAILRTGARVRDLVIGREGELRVAIREALVTAAATLTLPTGTDADWVANAIIEGRLADGTPAALSGITTDRLQLGTADFARRLRSLMPPDLISDLEGIGVDTTALFEAFGDSFPETVRSHGARPESPLSDLAARIEASASQRSLSAITEELGINLAQTAETLASLRRASEVRSRRRLDALGVPDELIDTVQASIETTPLYAVEPGKLVVLEAEAGAGKSTAGERVHLAAIGHAEADPTAPLPVFIEANRLQGSVGDEVRRLWGSNSELATRGVSLVVDGADEVGTAKARQFVLDAKAMLRGDPERAVSVLVTQRPLDLGLHFDEAMPVIPLSEEQAALLVRQLSRRDLHVWMYSSVIRDAIRWPFFAIAVGLAGAEATSPLPPTRSAVIESVVRRALRDTPWEDAAELLGRAAVASVDAGHRPVPIGEVATNYGQEESLRSSRLVRVDDERISFQIALIAEWFAAEHLRANLTLVDALVTDARRLDLWRFPLLLATESQGFDRMQPAMTALAENAPGMAGWILTQPDRFDALRRGSGEVDDVATQDSRQLATRLRHAFSALGDGLEPLSRTSALYSTGRLVPIVVSTSGRECDYAWHRSDPGLPDVLDSFPVVGTDDYYSNWLSLTSATMSDHPAWVWRHAQDHLRRLVEASLKSGAVFSGAPVADAEARWNLAMEALGRRGAIGARPIERNELAAILLRHDDILRKMGIEDARDDRPTARLRQLVAELEFAKQDVLDAPWPAPDRLHQPLPSGWVWNFWSPAALVERARASTRAGLDLYKHAIDSNLRRFEAQLQTSAAWPVRVVGYMTPADGYRGLQGMPVSVWYLDFDASEVSSDWQLVTDLRDIGEQLHNRRQGHHYGELHGIYSSEPATAFATLLLWDDLSDWGWVKGPTPKG